MQIISHRGFWKNKIGQNSISAFSEAIVNGFGIELDVRDLNQDMVIAHDLPHSKNINLLFEKVLELKNIHKIALAINIKADGLQDRIITLLKQYQISNYFLFDMAVPDAISYYRKGLRNIYSRQSEYELEPSFYGLCSGVWLDEFEEEWITQDVIKHHLKNQKKLCIVSPELHKKQNHLSRWQFYKSLNLGNNLSICTDYPDQANSFFNE